MGDAVIVQAVRTPIGNGKPTGALAGVHPVDSISRDVRPALGADLTPATGSYGATPPDNVVRRHGR
jgi:acetyl-CoA acetyltransferase